MDPMEFLMSKNPGFFVQASNDSQYELPGGNALNEENKDCSNNGKAASQIQKYDISEKEPPRLRNESRRNTRKNKKHNEEIERDEQKEEKEVNKVASQNHEEEKNELCANPQIYNPQAYLSQLEYINNTLNQMSGDMRRLFQELQCDFAMRQNSFYANPTLAEQWALLLDSAFQIGNLIEEIKTAQNYSTQQMSAAFSNGYSMYNGNQAGMYIDRTPNQ
jgi:hypothetical protein